MIWLAAPDPKLDRRCFIVRDYKGQALAYVYFEGEPGRLSRRLKGPGHSGGTKTISPRSCNGVSVSRVWGGKWPRSPSDGLRPGICCTVATSAAFARVKSYRRLWVVRIMAHSARTSRRRATGTGGSRVPV